MEFFVYSRRAIEAVSPHDVPHAIISITSAPEDVARLRTGGHCRGVLRLSFPDAEDPSEGYAEEELFSRRHATQIWDFAMQHRGAVQRFLLHCDAGISRSAAVAAALAHVLGGDEAEFFSERYQPNGRVYRMLLETAPTLR